MRTHLCGNQRDDRRPTATCSFAGARLSKPLAPPTQTLLTYALPTREFARRKPAAAPFSDYLLPLSFRPSPAANVTAFAVFIPSSSLTHRPAPGKTLLHCRLHATAKFGYTLMDQRHIADFTSTLRKHRTEPSETLACYRSMRR
jgi:hypothetical protein